MPSIKPNNNRTPGSKRVSFHVRIGSLTRWVKARTMEDSWGFYQDKQYIYTDQGEFLKIQLLSTINEEPIIEEAPGN